LGEGRADSVVDAGCIVQPGARRKSDASSSPCPLCAGRSLQAAAVVTQLRPAVFEA
jgi:hypothetical protein